MESASFASSIRSPFPGNVSFSVVTEDEDEAMHLLPDEAVLISERASPKRVIEVTRGRNAARRALKRFGDFDTTPILRGALREPLFPRGYCGTISHTDDLAVAAVARSNECQSLGVDVQKKGERFTPELVRQFADTSEIVWIDELPQLRNERACTIFSAKESIFKALNPIVRVWFGFECATISQNDAGVLTANVRPYGVGDTREYVFQILTSLAPNHVVTGVMVDSSQTI